jgi:hypothetical protein
MPAPVLSRSSLTNEALIFAMGCLGFVYREFRISA